MFEIQSFLKLKSYCENQDFKGWDPYDGLNSKVFKATGLHKWGLARLAWIQGFKRSPINCRKLLMIPKQHNAKGVGLFLNGYCNLYSQAETGETRFGSKEEILSYIIKLADLLLSMQNKEYSGASWGYNFDWQSRAFFLPANTPTVVATSFVVEALIQAFEITKNKEYLDTAISSSKFILNDLNRINKNDDLFMFSYSPLDNRAVYNASLLGTKTLSLIYHYTKDEELKVAAFNSAKAVCLEQNRDGSFPHSDQVGQKWRDNFHTGFKLESLSFYAKYCNDNSFDKNLKQGFKYWKENFFDSDIGYSYYYDRGMNNSLVDLHCVAQALSTFHKLNQFNDNKELICKITSWSIKNMQDEDGYFYFQKKNNKINKTIYMRWPNAWMFYGLSYYILNSNDQ
jgi:hypothetical protein